MEIPLEPSEKIGFRFRAANLAKRSVAEFLVTEIGLSETGARQLADYFVATYKSLGVIPSQKKIVLERFFDESGGMQLVIHSPFGIRVNRAWDWHCASGFVAPSISNCKQPPLTMPLCCRSEPSIRFRSMTCSVI